MTDAERNHVRSTMRPKPRAPTGARRARFAKRAQLVFGLAFAAALLYRMLRGYFD